MPSPDIVRDIHALIQTKLTPAVPARWQKQFDFGMQAFSLRPFQSAGSNARQVVGKRATASTKCDRLLANSGLAAHFGEVFDRLGIVRRGSLVNVDHSDQDGLTSLVAAAQTRHGRAVPCLVATTYAHQIPNNSDKPRWQKLRAAMLATRKMQSFTDHTIDALQSLADRVGFWPKLVFDRGFANESLLSHLQAEGATFYVRLKAGRYVECDGRRTVLRNLPQKDGLVSLFGLTLRVVRTPKSRRHPEPWYVLTNDFGSSRTKVARIYYHRFEIEETFKDMKHLFGQKRGQFTKPESLQTIWWLVALGIALLYTVTKPSKAKFHAGNPKKRISWLRQAYEHYQLACGQLIWRETTG